MKTQQTLRSLRRWPLLAYGSLLLVALAARAAEPPATTPAKGTPPPSAVYSLTLANGATGGGDLAMRLVATRGAVTEGRAGDWVVDVAGVTADATGLRGDVGVWNLVWTLDAAIDGEQLTGKWRGTVNRQPANGTLTGTVQARDTPTALTAIDAGVLIHVRGPRYPSGGHVPPDLPAGAGLEMVSPRAGQASAQALLTGEKLDGITARVTALTGPEGAVLPADAVSVRYLTGPVLANRLCRQPVETQRQPILVTVKVPATATPGIYRGQLQASCAGFTGQLPVQVEVMAWALPPREQWQTIAGLLHSPDSVALQYNVEPWSERHLALMESSLRLLAGLGGRDAKIYLIANGIENERYSMVRYRDGKPDFTCVDRYLDLWQKTCGTPRTITLYLWDNTRRNWGNDRLVDGYTAANSVQVTGIGADGKLTNFPAPYYTTPEAGAFWKPVFDGLKERVAKRGWKNTEMLLGHPWDSWPQEEAIEFLQQAAGLRWRVFSHAYNYPKPDAQGRLLMPCGAEVGWQETVVPVGENPGAPNTFNALAKRVYSMTTAGRSQTEMTRPTYVWRDYPATAIRKGMEGISEVGIDYWNLPGGGNILRNPGSGFEPRHGTAKAITVPGPDGAEPLLQYLMLQEGLQVCEAWWQVRAGGNDAADKAFDTFIEQRLQCNQIRPWPGGKWSGPPNITDQGHWHNAIRDLYRAAAAGRPPVLPARSELPKTTGAEGGNR